MTRHTKIDDSFSYQAEQAKRNFQYTVNGLLELHQFLSDKLLKAKNKDAVFFNSKEIAFMNDWLLRMSTSLMSEYNIITRTNKHVNVQYESMVGLVETFIKKQPE